MSKKVADDLKHEGKSEAQTFTEVSVLFSYVVNSTSQSSQLDSRLLIGELSEFSTMFDRSPIKAVPVARYKAKEIVGCIIWIVSRALTRSLQSHWLSLVYL